jgi:1-acyl-sn-glycerol-3-phosphate acyltransferase
VAGGGRGAFGAASTIRLDAARAERRRAQGAALDAGPAPAPEVEQDEDPFGLDLTLLERVLPAFRFMHDTYWRVETTGLHNLPADGPVILVSNHSGAIPFDGAMIATTVLLHRERVVRFLYDRFVDKLSPVAAFYRKVGGASASRENALTLLREDQPLLIFPEGVSGVSKPFSDRYQLRSFSPGFARLALGLDVPVVPVAVVGAEEIYPLVGKAEGITRTLGVPYLPITPFFPLLGLLGTVPLPTKWFIRFGKPIRLKATDDEVRWERARLEAMRVRRTVQGMVARLKRRRKSVFFG